MAYDTLKGLIRQYIKTNGQNEITGQILQNVLIAMVDEYPSLTGYATQSWVQSQGYMTEADLSNYATQTWVEAQLLGYLPTSTAIINNVVQSADGSLKLSGRNFADTYLDFTHTHRFEELTDLPTTLQDYGITDAYISSGVVYLGGASVGSSTNPISNATRATSAGSASYADEAREADTLDGHHASDFLTSGALEGYATQSWVNTQLYGYLPLSAGSGNPLTGDLYMDDNYVRFESGTQAIGYSSRINSSQFYIDKTTAATLGTDSVSVEGGKITVYSEYNDFDEGMVSNELVITATGIKVNNQPFATQSWVQSQGYATQSWVQQQGYITSAALTGYATQTWVGQYFVPISATYINEVTKSDDGTLKFAGSNFADTYIDFTHTHRFEELTDLPSTLQDYGITDAYISSGVVYLGGASVGSSTNPISNATRATSAGSASYADEAREADTLDGHHASDFLTSGALEGYATQSWVNTQLYGYLPLSAGSGNPLTGDLYMDDNYVRFDSGTQAIGYSSRINASQFYIDKTTAATLGTDSVSVEGGKITVYSEYNDFDEGMVSNELVITATGIKVNNQPFATQAWVQSQGYITSAALTGYATQTWVGQYFVPISATYINEVTKSDDGTLKFAGSNFADMYLDFTHTHRFEELTDLPTTLQDYGIMDAYISSGVVYLGGASVGSSTNPISNATRATSAGSASYADEAREADTLDGHHASEFLTSGALEGYATQSWVNSNYLPTSALTGYATQSWVNSNYLPTSTVLVNTLAKSADGSMKFSGRNFANTYVDFTHDHRWEEIVDRPNIEIGGYGMTYTDGKFGVGIKVPSYPIDVDGSVRATSFVNSSDARLKDIEDYDADISAEAVAMAPAVHYQWKNRNDRGLKVGSIAQYWQNLIPEAVSKDDKGYLSMQYDVIALISAISIAKRTVEHEQRIAELESENAQLRLELNSIRKRL